MPELWKMGSQGPPGRLPCAQPQHQARQILDEPLAHHRGRYLHLMIPVSACRFETGSRPGQAENGPGIRGLYFP